MSTSAVMPFRSFVASLVQMPIFSVSPSSRVFFPDSTVTKADVTAEAWRNSSLYQHIALILQLVAS